jgi:ubiquinone/menaquinone biosynthesis C-methylase UbiE
MDAKQFQRNVLTPGLGIALLSYAETVFKPYLFCRRLGLTLPPHSIGTRPSPQQRHGGGPALSRRHTKPVFLPKSPENYDTVSEFDHWSEQYDGAIRSFVKPIFDETFALMKPHLAEDARVLDPSCGPGGNAIEIARALPRGEVVAADLSRGMVKTAFHAAQSAGLTNMAFFQADVVKPPKALLGYFDAIFCCLSFHHYADAEGAARSFRRVLAPHGKVFIADGGPDWFVALAREISVAADPGFVQHRTGKQFVELFTKAGFSSVFWIEALPGIGVTIAAR